MSSSDVFKTSADYYMQDVNIVKNIVKMLYNRNFMITSGKVLGMDSITDQLNYFKDLFVSDKKSLLLIMLQHLPDTALEDVFEHVLDAKDFWGSKSDYINKNTNTEPENVTNVNDAIVGYVSYGDINADDMIVNVAYDIDGNTISEKYVDWSEGVSFKPDSKADKAEGVRDTEENNTGNGVMSGSDYKVFDVEMFETFKRQLSEFDVDEMAHVVPLLNSVEFANTGTFDSHDVEAGLPDEKPDVEPTLLDIALEIVSSDRRRDYGRPLINHLRIAIMWSMYCETTFTPDQVAWMMVIVKVARETQTPKYDNIVDTTGYSLVLDDMYAELIERDDIPANNRKDAMDYLSNMTRGSMMLLLEKLEQEQIDRIARSGNGEALG